MLGWLRSKSKRRLSRFFIFCFFLNLKFFLDIDECRVGAADCAPESRCHNQEGGYKCICPDGMLGDGKSCYPYTEVGNDYAGSFFTENYNY